MGPAVYSDPVTEAYGALRKAIERNMSEPSETNRAECSRLGFEYRKAVEAREERRRHERLVLEALEAATRTDPPPTSAAKDRNSLFLTAAGILLTAVATVIAWYAFFAWVSR